MSKDLGKNILVAVLLLLFAGFFFLWTRDSSNHKAELKSLDKDIERLNKVNELLSRNAAVLVDSINQEEKIIQAIGTQLKASQVETLRDLDSASKLYNSFQGIVKKMNDLNANPSKKDGDDLFNSLKGK